MHEDQFKKELIGDEKILWTGRPESSVIFTAADIFLIPFSILWGGFAVFWESMALFAFLASEGEPVTAVFPLFGIPFVVIGLYFIFGRFWFKKRKKKETYYALTDKRALILTKWPWVRFESIDLKQISSIQKSIRTDGIGTLKFGDAGQYGLSSVYQNTGMDLISFCYGPITQAFYDIKDAGSVYDKAAHAKASV